MSFSFFLSKIAIYLSLGLHKGSPSCRRSLQPSKENIQHFKTKIYNFFLFLWVIFALGSTDLIEPGSGSETLLKTNMCCHLRRIAGFLLCLFGWRSGLVRLLLGPLAEGDDVLAPDQLIAPLSLKLILRHGAGRGSQLRRRGRRQLQWGFYKK